VPGINARRLIAELCPQFLETNENHWSENQTRNVCCQENKVLTGFPRQCLAAILRLDQGFKPYCSISQTVCPAEIPEKYRHFGGHDTCVGNGNRCSLLFDKPFQSTEVVARPLAYHHDKKL